MGFSTTHLLIMIVILALVIPPYWKLTTRAGYPGALSLLVLVPLVGFIYMWWLAFSRWKDQPAP